MKREGKPVFYSTFLILITVVILNSISPTRFQTVMEVCNEFIGVNFGWFFGIVGVVLVGVCIYVYFSPLGETTIGGEGAEPLLDDWNWFAITLCTTIAAGILFWSAAEPIYHLASPPKFLNIGRNSYSASVFSMSTMFLHWGFTPYAIFCAPALIFAFSHYNMKKAYSFNSCLIPLLGDRIVQNSAGLIDGLCLFVTGTGLAASLSTVFLSFVTAADSTTNAMANLSVSESVDGNLEPPAKIKIAWGVLIGGLSLIMITEKGVLGVKCSPQ